MYLEFLKKRFQEQFSYRANTVILILVAFIRLFVSVSVWSALYHGRSDVDGVTKTEMITYLLVSQLVSTLVRLNVSGYVADRSTSGNVSIDFIRPVNLKLCAVFDSLGAVLYQVTWYSIPLTLVGALAWGISLPPSFSAVLFFLISLLLALVLYATMEYIMGLTSFWTKTNFHISWVIGSFMQLFSGSMIPLWFYPKSMKIIADVLPFKYFIFEPLNIFLGKTSFQQNVQIVLMQLLWLVILLLIEKLLWHFAQRVITVQGG